MNTKCLFSVSLAGLAFMAQAAAPSVTDVTFKQGADHVVRITYKLTGADAIVTADVQTNAVADGSGAWTSVGGAAQRSLGGDVNRKVTASADETKSFAWVPDATWEGVSLPAAQMRVVVTAWTELDPPDYLVADLRCPSNHFYYAAEDFLPGSVHDVRYKTEYIVFRRIHAKNVTWTIGADRDTTTKNVGIETLTTYPDNALLHKVKITYDYWMGIFELTAAQKDWAARNISYDKTGEQITGWTTRDDIRAGTTAWPALDGNDAFDYRRAHALNNCVAKNFRIATGLDWVDLPTEAEWEFACRAGVPNPIYTGKKYAPASIEEVAVSTRDGGRYKVGGTKRPNAWGLYDMLGNRAEFCLDWYETWNATTVPDQAAVRVDPYGAATGSQCVVRGGHVDMGGNWYIYDSPSSGITGHWRGSTSPSAQSMGSNGGYRLMARIGDPD